MHKRRAVLYVRTYMYVSCVTHNLNQAKEMCTRKHMVSVDFDSTISRQVPVNLPAIRIYNI